MKITVFDTETTGLWKEAHIVDLCWRTYDEAGKELKDPEQYIIKPDGYDHMPKVVEDIHGISFDEAVEKGYDKEWVIRRFMLDVSDSDYIVCHNASFDKRMIRQELERLGMEFSVDVWPESICTMQMWKKQRPEPARLQSVYYSLFKQEFEGWHTCINDVGATARVLFEMHRLGMVEF